MTNDEATFLYRRDIAAAIASYSRKLREIFEAWGRPIPPTQDCMAAMVDAWATCRVAFARADGLLDKRRADARLNTGSYLPNKPFEAAYIRDIVSPQSCVRFNPVGRSGSFRERETER